MQRHPFGRDAGSSQRAFLRGIGLLALAAACVPAGCEDENLGHGPKRQPLDFIYFVHPGAVDADTPSRLRAGVLAGNDLCWRVAGAGIDRDGNRLVISGVAHHDSRASVACPQALAHDTLSIAIPPLETGDYLLVAGSLVDTLRVASPAPRPAGKPFAARGDACSADPGCLLFRCDHVMAPEIEGILTGPVPAPSGCRLLLAGSVAGRDTCSGAEHNLIQARGVTWLVP
jgi:hypothetical protein